MILSKKKVGKTKDLVQVDFVAASNAKPKPKSKTMNTEINYSLKQVKPVLDRLLAFINSPEGQAITKAFDKYSQKGISYEIEGKYRLAVYPYGIELFRDGVSIHHSRTVLTGISKMMR